MNAIIYILIRSYINRIKGIFKKPSSAILTVVAILFILGGPIFVLAMPENYQGIAGGAEVREIIIACGQLFVAITFLLSALSQQSGLFSYSEAHILFSSPFSKKTILMYSTLQTLPASFLTALFVCCYLPYFIGGAMTPLKLLITVIITSLMVFCVYIIYYYVYIQDIARPGLKKRLKKYTWAVFAAVAAIYALIWLINGHDFGKAAVTFFISPAYNAIPLVGWAKWAVAALLNGDYITGLLPAAALLAAAACLLAKIYYSQDVDFYEKAQLDSIRIQKIMEGMRKGGYEANNAAIKKVRNAKSSFRPGAAAIMSRQLLEMKKRGPFLTIKDFINGAIYLIIGFAASLGFEFVYIMIIFSMVMSTATDSWNSEFKKPYVFLIPEKPVKKLVYAVLPSVVKTALGESLTVAVGAMLFGIGIMDTVFYIILLVSYVMLFTAAGVFTYRISGIASNAIVQMFLRSFFVMLSAIPGGIFAIISYVVTGITAVGTLTLPLAIVNTAFALLFLMVSRKLLERSELTN